MLLRVQAGGKWGIDIDSDGGVSYQLHWELSGIPCFFLYWNIQCEYVDS